MKQIGFSYEFYDEYHQVHPRSSPYYDERQKLYELYHHLNVRYLLSPYNGMPLTIQPSSLQSLGTIYWKMNSTHTCSAGVTSMERWGS